MGRRSRRKKAGQTTVEDVAEIRPLEPAAAPVQVFFFKLPLFHILLIIFLSLIAYSNTFESSFHFDDEHYIVKNSAIRDLRNFTGHFSSRDLDPLFKYKTLKRRYIGYLTFALNYRLHGLNVTGYHVVNLFVHICTALLLYFLILLTFKTPSLRNCAIKEYERHIALFTALLFACHPLQTQAVTYIWQRVASLCTMFYLLSLVAYIKWRLITEKVIGDRQDTIGKALSKDNNAPMKTSAASSTLTLTYYVLSLMSAILAMNTKQIAFMLPVMIVLYEFIFLRGKIKKRALYLIPFLVTMLIIPLTYISNDKPVVDLIGGLKGSTLLSRGEYLLTEFRVLVTYLRLIFLPVNQSLYYDYSRYHSFFNLEVFSSFIFLAFIFGSSIYILFRYRDSAPHTRLISFGIIWFFINLLLESSIIPLHNVIFEHRMYLPSVGVFSALTIAIFMAINRWKVHARVITVVLAVIIIVLTGATYARNAVWKDELTLWQDVVKKSPNKARGYYNLGNAYKSKGLIDKAIEQYQIAIKLNPYYPDPYINLGNAYKSLGSLDMAITQYQIVLKINPKHSGVHYNLANIFLMQGLTDNAIRHYQNAIISAPTFSEAYKNLGNAYLSQGLIDKAIEQYLAAIKFNSNSPDAYYNLGIAYTSKGLIDKAIEQYLAAIKLNPDNPDAYYNLGFAYTSKGLIDKAKESYKTAQELQEAGGIQN